jgi:hypothetical protein
MGSKMLEKVDESLKTYRAEHRGETPLYILVSSGDMENLLREVRERGGFPEGNAITSYHESKIVDDSALRQGELRLSNDLPSTGA